MRAITGTPWLIVPENLQAILDIVNMRINGEAFSDEEIRVRLKEAKEQEDRENPRVQKGGGVGVLSLYGPVFPKANLMTMLSGATSLEAFTSDMQELLDDKDVKQIVVDFDTPGGTSDLVEETGDFIREARGIKPIYGIANTFAGSAGLWLLSQTSKAYSTPSGKVGSLGVYTTHEDYSAQDEKLGRKITIVSAGKYKTALNPHEPLSEEGKAYMKEDVDELMGIFVNAVAKGRGLSADHVIKNFGDGKMLSARKAKDVNMIDGVISMNDLLDQLVEKNYATTSSSVRSSLAHKVSKMQAIMQGSPLNVESKEWEHSEPGTGNPPQPKEDEDGSDDPAIEGGWRRQTPPIESENVKTVEGRNEVDFEEKDERELRKILDIDTAAEFDSGKLVEAVKLKFGELAALKEAVSVADQEKEFAEKYPAFWNEHNELMKRDRANSAKTFSQSVETVRRAEGYGLRETRQGLSAAALTKVEDMHIKFAEGKASLADFEECIKTITNGGIVKMGEIGSSTEDDNLPMVDTSSAVGVAAARKLFGDVVSKEQAKNDKMTYPQAVAEAAKKHPELWEAYQIALPA